MEKAADSFEEHREWNFWLFCSEEDVGSASVVISGNGMSPLPPPIFFLS